MTALFRFQMTWTISLAEGSDEACLREHAAAKLAQPSLWHVAEVALTSLPTNPGNCAFTVLLDVIFPEATDVSASLMQAPSVLQGALVSDLPMQASLQIEILREASFSEVVDHADISAHYEGETTQDDYPGYVPQTHPDWPEANEVFFQDGLWWWCETRDGRLKHGPSAGPDPKRIFAQWDPEFPALPVAA